MIANVKCPACPFTARAKVPDDAKKVKCPKCGTRIELNPPPAEEEFYVDEIIEDEPAEPELTLAPLKSSPPPVPNMTIDDPPEAPPQQEKPPPMVIAVPESEETWDLTQPRSFGIHARSVMGGVSYEICDADADEVVGMAREKVDGNKAMVGVLFGRHATQGVIFVTDDQTGDALMVIERQNLGVLGMKPANVKLYDQHDEVLASFEVGKRVFGGLGIDFDVDCVIYGDDDEKWGIAKGQKKKNPDYDIRDIDGTKLARVRGKGKPSFIGPSNSWTGRGGWLKVTLEDHFDASPSQKLIVLGVVIAIESLISTLKEQRPGRIRLG